MNRNQNFRNKVISPKKPILLADFRCSIKLKKDEVDVSDIKTMATKNNYREQTSRHITITGRTVSRIIRDTLDKFSPKKKSQIVKQIKLMINKLNWQFTPKDIYHVFKHGNPYEDKWKGKRKSYIRTIDMPAMRKFYAKLNALLDTKIPTQLPHITLFTRGEKPNCEYYGISIRSTAIFNKLHPKTIITSKKS